MERIEKYQSELGEKAIKIVLERWWALRLEKIPRKNGTKTPDYRILNADKNTIAVCEIKSCVDAHVKIFDPKKSHEQVAEEPKQKDGAHWRKLDRHHEKALSQLVKYRDLPTLIVFVSFDMTDGMDMGAMLQNYEELYSSAAMADLYLLIKIHQNIIPSNKFTVTDMAQLMHSNGVGEDFGHKYLSLKEAWQNNGTLPAIFCVDEVANNKD